MQRLAVVAAAGAAMACTAFAGTAGADTAQSGCQDYGQFVAQTAQSLNSSTTPGGGGAFISGIATSGSGAVAATATYLKQLTCP